MESVVGKGVFHTQKYSYYTLVYFTHIIYMLITYINKNLNNVEFNVVSLIWPNMGPGVDSCEHSNEHAVSVKYGEFYD